MPTGTVKWFNSQKGYGQNIADHLLITSGKLGYYLVRLAARRRPLDARAVVPRFDPSHRDVVGGAEIVADEILEDDAHVSAQRTEIVLSQIVATPRTARTR
jgi:hypothetical protein